MNIQELNLARKWRSATFDEMVGQELTLRIIKNTLFKGDFFPVYLLSGQRGCGKTTTGRLFAAAVNCQQLGAFQKEPQKILVPCGTCVSCHAMKTQSHPDFIEIDAASHTGVEHVRTLIEAASFLPLLGTKKVYLIDEAHMLSKAAFNAFLKILEEPPRNVIFFLATTEPNKILDTVRSRCFQLFFDPVSPETLVRHLQMICSREQIAYEQEALALIVEQTEGSVRDALNMVERVRLMEGRVTVDLTQKLLGIPSQAWFVELIAALKTGNELKVIALYKESAMRSSSVLLVWKRIAAHLIRLVQEESSAQQRALLLRMLETCYHAEALLLKAQAPLVMLELFLLTLTRCVQEVGSGTSSAAAHTKALPVAPQPQSQTERVQQQESEPGVAQWKRAVEAILAQNDPLLSSIFKQAQFDGLDDAGTITLRFGTNYLFFKDLLESTALQWRPVLYKIFNKEVRCVAMLGGSAPVAAPEKKVSNPTPVVPPVTRSRTTGTIPQTERTQTLVHTFGGSVTEIKE